MSSPTTKISKYLDHFFKKQVPKAKSYIKNSQSLINTIKNLTLNTTKPIYLVSVDVKSLYTTIPQHEGIQCLLRHNELTGFPTHVTRKLLNYILNNIFSFNGTIYKQKMGVAMGTPIAPTLANIFMTQLEEEFLNTQEHKPIVYKRYIDDIFIIWDQSLEDFNTFMQAYNNFHPTIKFEHNISENTVDYLDLTIYKGNNFEQSGKLETKTHIKNTNTFQYIHYDSHHPSATKLSVLKSELTRYRNQCSQIQDYNKLKKEYIEHFLSRGYPYKTIIEAIKNTEEKKNTITTPDENRSVYPFIIEYDKRQQHPKAYISQHTDILLQDITTAKLHSNRRIIAYVNKKSIGKLCTKSPLTQDIIRNDTVPSNKIFSIPQLINKCGSRNCATCPLLQTKNVFYSHTLNRRICIRNRFTCQSSNLIYVLQCPICDIQYVGQTKSTLRQRMVKHRNKYNDKLLKPRRKIYEHFDQHVGKFTPIIIPVAKANPGNIHASEKYWINKIGSLTPAGLNDIWL
jgi:hypothetical protein